MPPPQQFFSSPSSPPPRNKVMTQREYREKEGACISTLREIIRQLTGEVLQTRQEVLRKAIDLLSSDLQAKMQAQAQPTSRAPYEMPVTAVAADTTLAHLDYPTQSPYLHQTWQNPESIQSAYYPPQPGSQQQHPMFDMGPTFEEINYQEFGGTWHDMDPTFEETGYQEFGGTWPDNSQL